MNKLIFIAFALFCTTALNIEAENTTVTNTDTITLYGEKDSKTGNCDRRYAQTPCKTIIVQKKDIMQEECAVYYHADQMGSLSAKLLESGVIIEPDGNVITHHRFLHKEPLKFYETYEIFLHEYIKYITEG